MAKLVSNKEYLDALKQKEAEKKSKKTKKTKPNKSVPMEMDKTDIVTDEIDSEDSITDIDSGEETQEFTLKVLESANNATKYMNSVWRSLNPPIKEEEIVGKWYACVYGEKKKQTLYIAKINMRYLFDVDGPTTDLFMSCLKPGVGSTTILEESPEDLTDEGKFPIYNVIAGPLNVLPIKGRKWEIPDYPKLRKFFDMVAKMDRQELVKTFNENV